MVYAGDLSSSYASMPQAALWTDSFCRQAAGYSEVIPAARGHYQPVTSVWRFIGNKEPFVTSQHLTLPRPNVTYRRTSLNTLPLPRVWRHLWTIPIRIRMRRADLLRGQASRGRPPFDVGDSYLRPAQLEPSIAAYSPAKI